MSRGGRSRLDRDVLATMMRSLDRFSDGERPVEADDVDALRSCFRDWAEQLS